MHNPVNATIQQRDVHDLHQEGQNTLNDEWEKVSLSLGHFHRHESSDHLSVRVASNSLQYCVRYPIGQSGVSVLRV